MNQAPKQNRTLIAEVLVKKTKDQEYPEPTDTDLESEIFLVIWNAIKDWDISRNPKSEGYASATGNDVMHIILALRKLTEKNYIWQKTINPL